MTPTPDAVKASAIEELCRYNDNGCKDWHRDSHAGELETCARCKSTLDLSREARAELSALRRGVSVEEACTDALRSIYFVAGEHAHWVVDNEKLTRALMLLNPRAATETKG